MTMLVEAIERAAAWIGKISPPGITGFGEEDARRMWQAGNAGVYEKLALWPMCLEMPMIARSKAR